MQMTTTMTQRKTLFRVSKIMMPSLNFLSARSIGAWNAPLILQISICCPQSPRDYLWKAPWHSSPSNAALWSLLWFQNLLMMTSRSPNSMTFDLNPCLGCQLWSLLLAGSLKISQEIPPLGSFLPAMLCCTCISLLEEKLLFGKHVNHHQTTFSFHFSEVYL